jgi:hypothetical protein
MGLRSKANDLLQAAAARAAAANATAAGANPAPPPRPPSPPPGSGGSSAARGMHGLRAKNAAARFAGPATAVAADLAQGRWGHAAYAGLRGAAKDRMEKGAREEREHAFAHVLNQNFGATSHAEALTPEMAAYLAQYPASGASPSAQAAAYPSPSQYGAPPTPAYAPQPLAPVAGGAPFMADLNAFYAANPGPNAQAAAPPPPPAQPPFPYGAPVAAYAPQPLAPVAGGAPFMADLNAFYAANPEPNAQAAAPQPPPPPAQPPFPYGAPVAAYAPQPSFAPSAPPAPVTGNEVANALGNLGYLPPQPPAP